MGLLPTGLQGRPLLVQALTDRNVHAEQRHGLGVLCHPVEAVHIKLQGTQVAKWKGAGMGDLGCPEGTPAGYQMALAPLQLNAKSTFWHFLAWKSRTRQHSLFPICMRWGSTIIPDEEGPEMKREGH